MLLFFGFIASAIGDTGAPPTPDEACQDAWQLAVDHLLEQDPSLVDPCGSWDPGFYDPETGVCSFTCGGDSHVEVIR